MGTPSEKEREWEREKERERNEENCNKEKGREEKGDGERKIMKDTEWVNEKHRGRKWKK